MTGRILRKRTVKHPKYLGMCPGFGGLLEWDVLLGIFAVILQRPCRLGG